METRTLTESIIYVTNLPPSVADFVWPLADALKFSWSGFSSTVDAVGFDGVLDLSLGVIDTGLLLATGIHKCWVIKRTC